MQTGIGEATTILVLVLITAGGYGASIDIGEKQALAGTAVQVPVTVSADTDLAGINVRVLYDSSLLESPGAEAGPLLTEKHKMVVHSPAPGELNVVAYAPSVTTAFSARSGTVLYLTFQVKASVQTGIVADIAIASVIPGPPDMPGSGLADMDGNSVAHDSSGGSVGLLPEAPSSPSPADGATDESFTKNLDWADSAGAEFYDVYFWREGAAKPNAPNQQDLTASQYDPASDLEFVTSYNWQVVAKNANGETAGPEWSFTTVPGDRPETPTNVRALHKGANKVLLVWTADYVYTSKYRIYAKDSGGNDAEIQGLHGNSVMHYVTYSEDASFYNGTAYFAMPLEGEYTFYISGSGWDEITWTDWVSTNVLVEVQPADVEIWILY